MLGTAKESQPTSPPGRADTLADVVLPDHEGRDMQLGDFWRHGPAAIVWLRHYGCVHCRQHAVQLEGARQRFEAAGMGLVLIGHGTPDDAASFRSQWGISLPVLADRRRESFRAAGAKVATMGELLGPKSVRKGMAATLGSRGRVRQGKLMGHPAQLGGVLVIDPDGTVVWAHMSEEAGDNAPPETILTAVEGAAAKA